MALKELIINGFKSFADKTTIKFDSGITEVVGPNGSGKSNITEAIRWVMGESSAKSLRGSNMKDVIFAGSQFRKPLDRAEVTMVFDNKDHELAYPTTEVSVSRKIFRNGTSEYAINGQDVRLKDIHSLFLDSGISQDSLAIISQGKVDEILNSKPEARRRIFEEAAGILHFKEQKQEASNQLEKTTDNLIRINDLVKELETRVEPLHEQSSLAKEYLFQKDQLDQSMKVLLALQISDLEQNEIKVQEQAKQKQGILDKLDVEVQSSQKDLEVKKLTYSKLTKDKENLQSQILSYTQKLSDLHAQLIVAEQSDQYDSATKDEYRKQLEQLKQNIKALTEQIKSLLADQKKLQNQLSVTKKEKKLLQEKLKKSPEILRKELEEIRDNYIQALQDQTSNNNEITHLTNEIAQIKSTKTFETQNVDSELHDTQVELNELTKNKTELETEIASLEHDEKSVKTNLQKSLQEQKEYTNKVNQYSLQLQKVQARRDAISAIQSRHEAYFYSVRNILNHREQYPGVIGVIGELLNFDARYEAALTTALGSGVQSLVVDTQENARDAIQTLKRMHAGWATFLPLNALHYRTVPISTSRLLQNMSGFVGIASELVQSDANIDNAINYLLGSTIVVDSINNAVNISREIGHYRIVTLDGDVINASGSMTGGERSKRNNSPLQASSQINTLDKQIAADKKQFAAAKNALAKIQAVGQKQSAELQVITENIQKYTQNLNTLGAQLEAKNNEYKRLTLANKTYLEQAHEKEQNLANEKQQLSVANKQKIKLDKQVAAYKAELSEKQIEISTNEEQNKQLQAKFATISSQLAVLQNKQSTTNGQLKDKNTQLDGTKTQLHALKLKIDQIGDNSQSNADKKEQYRVEIKNLEVKQSAAKTDLANINKQLGKLDAQINELNDIFTRNYELRKNMAREQEEYASKLADFKSQMKQKLATLSNDYSISYEAVRNKIKVSNTEQERAKLQKAVKLHQMSIADIGPVNVGSIDEYETVKTRYDFLLKQQNDLLAAKANIETSMSNLDTKVAAKFESTFKKIAASFKRIFPIVFGGGKAELVLTDEKNLLETGIEIIAQPPGKKLQRLSLLSGGERALTAITLLFAILDVNPVPFCILDEVEAALDEANVARFAKFLRHYDLHTQFIVITHRRGTMEQADQLYGVVMQESGVSQVVSVSLKEIKDKVK